MNEGIDSGADRQFPAGSPDCGQVLGDTLDSHNYVKNANRSVANSIKGFIIEMLSKSDSVSMTRVMSVLILTNIMLVWTLTCFKKWEIVDIPWGVVTVVGIVVTGKAVQRFAER